MKDYISEIACCPEEPYEKIIVYAPKWYRRGEALKDKYSMKIINSKRNDESKFFFTYLEKMIDNLKEEGKLKKIDLITIIPRSNGEESPTLTKLGEMLSNKLNTKFESLFNKKTKGRKNKKYSGYLERWKGTKDDFSLKKNLLENEKAILILDDQKTTGSTFIACGRILLKNGAKEVYYFCLGINRNIQLLGE